jgi:hypothetical protein
MMGSVHENPWWHPANEDNWDEPLPPVVILSPDYGGELPLMGAGLGELAWQFTKFSPALLDRLAAWQQEFDAAFHWQKGWDSPSARNRWASEARELAADVRAELGPRAELLVDLWPLADAVTSGTDR